MNKKKPEVFISAEQIEKKIIELADRINHDYVGKELTVICTLKGCVHFFSDLTRKLNIPVEFEFFGASSYGNKTTTSGEVKVTLDLSTPIENKHVLILEDIVDTGITLSFMLDTLSRRHPTSLKSAALLYKPAALRVQNLKLDYIGFEIQNQFVIGYGLDYAQKYRELPYIGVLKGA